MDILTKTTCRYCNETHYNEFLIETYGDQYSNGPFQTSDVKQFAITSLEEQLDTYSCPHNHEILKSGGLIDLHLHCVELAGFVISHYDSDTGNRLRCKQCDTM